MLRLLEDIAPDPKDLPRVDPNEVNSGDFIVYALGTTAILMKVSGRSRFLKTGEHAEERQIVARRVSIVEPGVGKVGYFRIPIDHDAILARGDEAFKLLKMEKPRVLRNPFK